MLTTAVLPVLADDNNGSGVVYEIHNAEELANLGGLDIVGDIELLADIDMANVEMQPIASFQGNLNGNGYTISNLSVTAEQKDVLAWNDPYQGAGLIAAFSGRASDIVFENPQITLAKGQNCGVAVLAGTIQDTTAEIVNCAVVGGEVNVTSAKTTHEGAFVGNVIGSELTIKNCFSTAEVKYGGSSSPSTNYAGGFIGYLSDTTLKVLNCAVLGDVTAYKTSGYAGGFIGIINGSNTGKEINFENCYFGGTVTGANKYGFAYSGRYAYPEISVENSYYDSDKNTGTTWSPFACFYSSAKVTGTVVATATTDFATLAMGDAFAVQDGYPYPVWYVSSGGTHTLTITVCPENAVVTLVSETGDEMALEKEGNRYVCDVESGKYQLTVAPPEGNTEYETRVLTVTVGKVDKSIAVELGAKTYEILFDISPGTASLTLYQGQDSTGKIISESGNNKYVLTAGEYYYEVVDFGYAAQSGILNVTNDENITVSLVESARHDLKFRVYPRNVNAEIRVTCADGDKREMEAVDGNYRLPEGTYDYQITAEGYKTKNGVVVIPDTDEMTVTLAAGNSWDGSISSKLQGEGTQENPYLIQNGGDLAYAAKQINDVVGNDYATAYYVMQDDIDLGYQVWSPVGKTSVNAFKGHFDGKGHMVSGLNVENSENSVYVYYGLFGCLDDAEVKNLTVSGEVYCDEGVGLVGGLAGCAAGNTVIENCASAVSISAKAGASVGGLVGLCRKSDDIGYQWIDNTVRFINCMNKGSVLMVGEDSNQFSQGTAGGIVGYSKNCVQFEHCSNLGTITGANIAAGICGNMGAAQGNNCHPYLNSCYNAGKIQGKCGAYPIYGKNSMGQAYVINCYALPDAMENNKYVSIKSAAEMKSDTFTALLNNGGDVWHRDDLVNGAYPYQRNITVPENSGKLNAEALKYTDVLYIPTGAAIGDAFSFLKTGEIADSEIQVSCVQTGGESYLTRLGNGTVKLKKENDTDVAVQETVTLLFINDEGRLRRNVTVILSPDNVARQKLMDKLAGLYAAKTLPDEWVVFDMAAYGAMKAAEGTEKAQISDSAKQNYINLAIDELNQSYTLPTDRAKAEIIMGAIGIDTTKLYPVNASAPINNAERLRKENFGTDYTTAVWALLADMQGSVQFDKKQINQLVDSLSRNQKENGLFCYTYGLNTYIDVDSTGWAVAALSRFVLNDNDNYGVKEKAQKFVDKAIAGLSETLGENGSYGNINSDAMVITGLVALGIDPAADSRFIKNGCSLADAPMLYVNSAKNGFVSAYVSGEQGEKFSAQATEQGFRGLIALEAFEKNGKKPYNIYAFNLETLNGTQIGTEPAQKVIVRATGKGSVELPDDPPASADNMTVDMDIKALNNTWVSGSFEIKEGATVYHLLKKVAQENNIEVIGLEKGYVKAMTYQGNTFSEFDKGTSSGWLYYVNDELPSVGMTDYVLKEGDTVHFKYTADYTKESGGSGMSGGGGGKSTSAGEKNKENANGENIEQEAMWENPFVDIMTDDWYYTAVRFVCSKNIMKGTEHNLFEPESVLSRAMFVTILYRMENEPWAGAVKFEDVQPDEWYANAVAWASEHNIVSGVSETAFAPDEAITREQMVAMIYRYTKFKGNDTTAGNDVNMSLYSDYKDISDYALPAIRWAAGSGLMLGKTADTIAPLDTATRAEAAAIIMRMTEEAK